MQTTTSTPRTFRAFLVLAFAALGILQPAAQAAIITSDDTLQLSASSGQNNATVVSQWTTAKGSAPVDTANDLLKNHATVSMASGGAGLGAVAYIKDGLMLSNGKTSGQTDGLCLFTSTGTWTAHGPADLVFTLDAAYNIGRIDGFTLWDLSRLGQKYDLYASTDGGANWNLVTSVNKDATGTDGNRYIRRISLTDSGGVITGLVGVNALKFHIMDPGPGGTSNFNNNSIYAEIAAYAAAPSLANAGTSTVTASPTSVASDGVTTSTITVTLKDATSAAVSGKTVTLASSRGATDTISAASGVSSASGVVTFTVKSSTAGAPVFTATDTTDSVVITQTATVTFLSAAVSAANSTVTASPSSIVADGSTTSTVTVTVKDSSSAVISGKTVTLAKTSGPGSPTITTIAGTTDGSGVATFTVKSTTAGADVFTATADSVAITQTATVTFTAGAVNAGTSTVVASPATVPADGSATTTITVTLKDANSNPVPGKTVTLASSRGATDTISAASGLSSATGVVTFTVTSLTAGSSVFTATGDSVVLSTTPGVTFTAVSAANSTVVAAPTSVAADGITTSTITVTLKDASGNPFAGKAVSLANTSGPGTPVITTVSGTTSASGVATFTVKSVTVGADVFTATDTTDSVTVTQTATVTFLPLVIVQSNASGAAGGFTVSSTDLVNQGQATLSSATRSHKPEHSTSGDFGGYDPNNTGLNVPYANDGSIGAFSTSPWGKNVEYYPVTNPTSAYALPVAYTFMLNTTLHPDGYDISGVTSTCGYGWNSNETANQVFQVEITKDGSTWLSLGTYTYHPYTAVGSGDQMSQVVLSNTGGGALNDGTHVAQHVTGIRITYSNPGDHTNAFDGTAIKEIDVLGAASAAYVVSASTSTVTASPTSVASDGVTTSTVTVTLKDAGGNPIPGKTVTLASSRTSTDTISAASGVSSASGVVTFTVKSSTAGTPVFTATDTSDSPNVVVTQTATVTFISNAVSAANSTVTASPTTVTADGSTTSTITVTLNNADNNPLSGKAVTLAKTSGPGSPTITTIAGTSDGSGVATFTVKSTTAGADVFTATADSVTITQTVTVTFTAGAVNAGTSTAAAAPAAAPADGTATTTVTVTLMDANSNPVTGKTVTLASSRTSTDTISAASGPSDASGVVTFTVTSLTAGSSVFTATGDSVALSTTPGVTFTAVSAANSTVVASPTTVAADGITTSTITVTLKDASGNPFAGKAVSLAHTSGPGTPAIATVSGTTSASGVATFTVKSATVGADVFTATDVTDSLVITPTATVTFAPLVIVQSNSSTNTSSANHAAGGFTVSATDLVNQGQATLSSATRSHVPLFGDPAGSNYDASNDGTVPVYVNDGQIGDFSTSPWGKNVELFANTTASGWVTANELLPVTYTFTLNTTLNPAGYDITNITSTCGFLWNRAWLADQKFQVEITQDGSTWLDFGTYSYIPVTDTHGSDTFETQVVLTNLGGGTLNTGTHVATNVRAIRVTYLSTNLPSPNSDLDGTAIKEIDVFGQASAAPVTAYTTWANGTFTNAFTDTTPTHDPDGDGLTNLQEYAFGTDPTVSFSGPISYVAGGAVTTPGSPLAANLAVGEGVDYRAVFGRRKDYVTAGLTYTVQFSVDMSAWTNSTDTPTVLTGAGALNPSAVEAVSVPYPLFIPYTRNGVPGYEKPTFFRVGISSN